MIKLALLLLCSVFLSSTIYANGEVALTIDDLPFVGNTHQHPGKMRRETKRFNQILDVLKANHIPAAGFVVAGAIEKGQWPLLLEFHNAGNTIANHTYSHWNLNRVASQRYIQDIQRADQRLSTLLTKPKYFRYPFLATGKGDKKRQVEEYLKKHNYIIVPVTIDSKDYKFNLRLLNIPWRQRKHYLSTIRRRYLNFIWMQTLKAQQKALKQVHRPIKQILLIHMNVLNSYFMQDIITLFRNHGYHFITMAQALKDPYYQNQYSKNHIECPLDNDCSE